MERPLFSVPLSDLDYGDRDLDEDIPVDWLARALEGTEATPRGTPGHLSVTLSKSGREVMVRGSATAAVTLPCARTLDPAHYDLHADIFLMLGPGPAHPAPTPAHPHKEHGHGHGHGHAPKKGAPEHRGKKGKGKPQEDEGALLGEDDAARDHYEGDKVVIDRFVREFLVLELPMVPLREDLRSEATPAIERPPEPAEASRPDRDGVDPRLAPLAALASRLRDKKE